MLIGLPNLRTGRGSFSAAGHLDWLAAALDVDVFQALVLGRFEGGKVDHIRDGFRIEINFAYHLAGTVKKMSANFVFALSESVNLRVDKIADQDSGGVVDVNFDFAHGQTL